MGVAIRKQKCYKCYKISAYRVSDNPCTSAHLNLVYLLSLSLLSKKCCFGRPGECWAGLDKPEDAFHCKTVVFPSCIPEGIEWLCQKFKYFSAHLALSLWNDSLSCWNSLIVLAAMEPLNFFSPFLEKFTVSWAVFSGIMVVQGVLRWGRNFRIFSHILQTMGIGRERNGGGGCRNCSGSQGNLCQMIVPGCVTATGGSGAVPVPLKLPLFLDTVVPRTGLGIRLKLLCGFSSGSQDEKVVKFGPSSSSGLCSCWCQDKCVPGKELVPFCFRMTSWECGSGVSSRKGNILPLLTEKLC